MNRGLRSIFCVLLLALVATISASTSHAQAIRTWVSGVGDDLNPCSRTAPCKTFAGAISKTQAGGEICALDPGGFGSVTIVKSITIDGTGVISGIAANALTGITVNIDTKDTRDTAKAVRLRGLIIDGYGSGVTGIDVMSGNLVVEDSVIDGFATGIALTAGTVFVKNCTLRNNGTAINVAEGKLGKVAEGKLGLTDSDLVFNGTAFTGAFASITWLNDVHLYGNKNGDAKPAGIR
jgi:hypothetical protein